MADERELTVLGRLGTMLIVASVLLPVLALAGILVTRHFLFVHYHSRLLTEWLVLDAVILAVGLIVRENDGLAQAPKPSRRRRMR